MLMQEHLNSVEEERRTENKHKIRVEVVEKKGLSRWQGETVMRVCVSVCDFMHKLTKLTISMYETVKE